MIQYVQNDHHDHHYLQITTRSYTFFSCDVNEFSCEIAKFFQKVGNTLNTWKAVGGNNARRPQDTSVSAQGCGEGECRGKGRGRKTEGRLETDGWR